MRRTTTTGAAIRGRPVNPAISDTGPTINPKPVTETPNQDRTRTAAIKNIANGTVEETTNG